MANRPQQDRLKWPLTAYQVETLDNMLETLYKRVRQLEDVARAAGLLPTVHTETIGLTIDGGGGAAITTGQKGYRQFDQTGTIIGWTLVADAAGSIVIGITKDPYASFPPSTSIVASAPPTLTSSDHATDSTLTGWTTDVTAGDVFGFTVSSTSVVSRVSLHIHIQVQGS